MSHTNYLSCGLSTSFRGAKALEALHQPLPLQGFGLAAISSFVGLLSFADDVSMR